jgi:hypothetical protein
MVEYFGKLCQLKKLMTLLGVVLVVLFVDKGIKMGTQVLAGSVGVYNPVDPKIFGKLEFTVTKDTCLEKDTLSVKFVDAIHETTISLSKVAYWTDRKTADY